jgi:preprotein translocase subunit YajC
MASKSAINKLREGEKMTLKLQLQILIIMTFIFVIGFGLVLAYAILRSEKKAKEALKQKENQLKE